MVLLVKELNVSAETKTNLDERCIVILVLRPATRENIEAVWRSDSEQNLDPHTYV